MKAIKDDEVVSIFKQVSGQLEVEILKSIAMKLNWACNLISNLVVIFFIVFFCYFKFRARKHE